MVRSRWPSSIDWSRERSSSRSKASPIAPIKPKAGKRQSERKKKSLLPQFAVLADGHTVTAPLALFRPLNWYPFSPPPTLNTQKSRKEAFSSSFRPSRFTETGGSSGQLLTKRNVLKNENLRTDSDASSGSRKALEQYRIRSSHPVPEWLRYWSLR